MGGTGASEEHRSASSKKLWLVTLGVILLCVVVGFGIWESISVLIKANKLQATRNARILDILKYTNQTVKPCNNFYEFACGNWKTHHAADSQITHTLALSVAHAEFEPKLYQLLNSSQTSQDTKAERKVKHFYTSCLHAASSRNSSTLKRNFKEIAKEFGGLDVLVDNANWRGFNFDWITTVGEISHRYGLNIILGYSIKPYAKNHTRNLLLLTNPQFSNNFEEFQYICEMIMVEYLNVPPKKAQAIAKYLRDLEANFWYISRFDVKAQEKRTWDSLRSDEIDLEKLVKITFGHSLAIDGIWLQNPGYVKKLIDLIRATPRKIISNYITLRLLYHFWLDVLGNHATDHGEACSEAVKHYFPYIISHMFYRHNNLQRKKKAVEDLWYYMKATLRSIIKSRHKLSWLDEESRNYALEKLDLMNLQVATYEGNSFEEDFAALQIDSQDYVENLRAIKSFQASKTRATLLNPPVQGDIDKTLDLQTPIYVINSNSVIIPVSVLASDFLWSPLNPNAINFARLGFCIAHEILHGFTGAGRRYDKFGNYFTWSHPQTDKQYAMRHKCYRQQYHSYSYGGVRLPLLEKQDENLADNAGIVLAYEAYLKWFNESPEKVQKFEMDSLSHLKLNYTIYQLFFISYSQLWCTDTLDAEHQRLFVNKQHAPSELRAFVPLTNFDKFSSEFECSTGSAMNPIYKCNFFD
uniref:Peptidase M13 C-terminal domain-containing protein n=1 Tax=Stomoxys calcitrans TaxID=35570 RepID=A0A1I8NRA5_STOCA